MHFCSECSNMYYIRIDAEDSNQLVYYCRKCGNEDKLLAIQNVCVSKTQIKQTDHSYDHIINKYTKFDPTMPRINTVMCPNSVCTTNADPPTPREIVSVRYNDSNMKYIYLCSTCDTVWKSC